MLEAFLKGITVGFLLSIAVGPVIFSIIKQSLNNGHKGGMAFVVGVSASDIALVLISNVFTELFSSISSHRTPIGIAGSIFLIVMGIYFLFFKKVNVDDRGQQVLSRFRKRDYAKIFASGFLMNTLNPAIFLFWITTSTTFVSHTVKQRLIIFITCLLFVLAADIAKVMLAGKIRNRLTPHNIHNINRLNGIVLIGFGIALIWGLLVYSNK
ncbi:LysE family translocator [Terrimonas pollutisoli]|uniref:LysE family translocator n=1 Tax=Terrimonas pollutisoli TaxID=3034147 RepID=UPI0023ED1173|nr:LysE family translocator [Terrimonas sp. H1YJ31]